MLMNMDKRTTHYPEAVAMYESGLSIQDVAAFYGVSRQSMWAWLRRRGVKMRSQRRYKEKNNFYRGGARISKRAHDLVEKAIAKGLLTKPKACEACGKEEHFASGRSSLESHHDDYNHPLTVRWLCRKCHHEWHEHHRAITVKRQLKA